MKKIILLSLLSAAAVALTGCVKDKTAPRSAGQPSGITSLTFKAPSQDDQTQSSTRVTIVRDAGNVADQVTWSAGDVIWMCQVNAGAFTGQNFSFKETGSTTDGGLFTLDETQTGCTTGGLVMGDYLAFLCKANGGGVKCAVPQAGDTHLFYTNPTTPAGPFSVNQKGTSLDALGQNILLVSGPVTISGTAMPAIQMNHTMSVVEFQVSSSGTFPANYVVLGFGPANALSLTTPGVILTASNTGVAGDAVFAQSLAISTDGTIDEGASTWGNAVRLSVSGYSGTPAYYGVPISADAANPTLLRTFAVQTAAFNAAPQGTYTIQVNVAPYLAYVDDATTPSNASADVHATAVINAAGTANPAMAFNIGHVRPIAVPLTALDIVSDGSTHITTAADFYTYFGTPATAAARAATYNLDADIDLSSVNGGTWVASTTAFTGVLHGNGHTISNITGNNALFGVGNGAKVDGLNVSSVTLDLTGLAINNHGVLFGYGNATPNTASSNITVDNCSLSNITIKTIAGINNIGAIAGNINGNSTSSITNTTVDGLTITKGDATGSNYVGGLVGNVSGTSSNVTISGCTVKNATIAANQYAAGGFMGYFQNANKITISGCSLVDSNVSLTTTSQSSGAGGFVGMCGLASGISIAMDISDCTVSASTPGKTVITGLSGMTINTTPTATGGGAGGILGTFLNRNTAAGAQKDVTISNCTVGAGVQIVGGNANTQAGGILGTDFSVPPAGSGGYILISGCTNRASILQNTGGANAWIGGIAGRLTASGAIVGCVNYGDVQLTVTTASQAWAGGIVGRNDGYAASTTSGPAITYGTAEGGGLITGCANFGLVHGNSNNGGYGGIAGGNSGLISGCFSSAPSLWCYNSGTATDGISAGRTGYLCGNNKCNVDIAGTLEYDFWDANISGLTSGWGTAAGTAGTNTGSAAFGASSWPTSAMNGWGTAPSISSLGTAWTWSCPWNAGYDTNGYGTGAGGATVFPLFNGLASW